MQLPSEGVIPTGHAYDIDSYKHPSIRRKRARLDNASQGLSLYHAECHELEIGQGPYSSRGPPDGDVPKVLQKTSYCAGWEFSLPYPH
jgi:hypothetical protein